jgi:hypothetical protein
MGLCYSNEPGNVRYRVFGTAKTFLLRVLLQTGTYCFARPGTVYKNRYCAQNGVLQ